MTTHQRILNEFLGKGYATSVRLAEIAGYRYSARLFEMGEKGFRFIWDYRKDAQGKQLKTTIYTMTTKHHKIDREKMRVV